MDRVTVWYWRTEVRDGEHRYADQGLRSGTGTGGG
jgi:hypothetical protein